MTTLKNIFKPEREYTVYQVALKLRTSKTSVYRWVEDGELKAEKRPHDRYVFQFVYWVKGSDVIEYLKKVNA